MENLDPKFLEMIDEIQEWVNRRIDKEWDDSFGSMVLVSAPREAGPQGGNVSGWVHPKNGTQDTQKLLSGAFFTLCVALMSTEDADPGQLHGLVMNAAAFVGKAIIIDTDGDLDGMTKN